MKISNYETRGEAAFYDSVANQTPLVSVAQAKKWSDELFGGGINTLYIKSLNDTYYRLRHGDNIEAIIAAIFEEEWSNCIVAMPEEAAEEISADDVACNDEIKNIVRQELKDILTKLQMLL